MSDDIKSKFWDRLDDIRAGMLSTDSATARPMAHYAKEEDQCLWFITAHGTDIANAAKAGESGRHIVACQGGQLYATIEGPLSVETSEAKLDELWSPMASAWFDEGREDKDICLVGLRPSAAEVWATDGSAKILYEMAKANLSDAEPSMGNHGHLRF